MSLTKDPVFTSKYAAVSAHATDEVAATITALPVVGLELPIRTVNSTKYGHIPETVELFWTDDFFDDDDDVVAVFDFDYEKMEAFYTSIGWVSLGLTIFCKPLMIAALAGLAPCYLRKNVRWNIYAQHVAITRDGIRFVHDKRPRCWGNSCTDTGKSSKTVPFDKITDCDLEEPAGNSCLCIENVLSTVNIDTAASGQGRHELQICGLKEPQAFKKLVWAMKRDQKGISPRDGKSRALEILQMSENHQAQDKKDISTLLCEIRDELKHNNSLLLSMQPPIIPSAPVNHIS